MTGLGALIKRNTKLFFKDKGMFFTSLVTPMILLILYATFLAEVYRDSFTMNMSVGLSISDRLIDGTVGAQLMSSLLAVCCVTVSFCSNMLMVQDKANGTLCDLSVSPVKSSTLALGYYISTVFSSLIICYFALAASMLYLSFVGFFLSVADFFALCLDVFLLVLFGTALSSAINCGAYMPISQCGEGVQKVVSFFPGTYGTSLLRNHAMKGVFAQMENEGIPAEVVESIKDSVDCNLYFFDKRVEIWTMYCIITVTVISLIAVYVLMNYLKNRRAKVK